VIPRTRELRTIHCTFPGGDAPAIGWFAIWFAIRRAGNAQIRTLAYPYRDSIFPYSALPLTVITVRTNYAGRAYNTDRWHSPVSLVDLTSPSLPPFSLPPATIWIRPIARCRWQSNLSDKRSQRDKLTHCLVRHAISTRSQATARPTLSYLENISWWPPRTIPRFARANCSVSTLIPLGFFMGHSRTA